uniref:acetyl-CoA carboxylase carboxyltransferase beta subunit n=1 Tax=Lygisma inflexum TaxID=2785596 RepID=UPI002551DD64|nr:acetyl-CoA carboxylase carboxyltransferase beta subunit [Lygisma inflexum]WEV91521.1 acetyl-CoA carboxylase carboxyltransferase beta subunit [Lygisma inflexum]
MTIHLLYFPTNRGQEHFMESWWFNSMLFKNELECRCGLNKSMDSLGPIENTGEIEDSNRKDATKNIQSWGGRDDSSYSNGDRLFGVKDIRNLIPNETFLVKDSNGDNYSIYFDSENEIFEIDNNNLFLSELESSFASYQDASYPHNESTSEDTYSNNDTQYSWNNHINSCIDSYLQSEICIDTSMVSDSDNCSDSYIYRYICGESRNNGEGEGSDDEREFSDDEREFSDDEREGSDDEREGSDDEREGSAGIRTHAQDSYLILEESSNDSDRQDEDSDLILEESSNDSDRQDEDSDLILEESSNDIDGQDSHLTLEESSNDIDGQDSHLTLEESSNDIDGQYEDSDLALEESSNDREDSSNDSGGTDKYSKYRHLWVLCDNCYGLNYKKFFKSKMNICEHCEWHLKMNSSDRIDLLIDPDTWTPMDEDMVSLDPIEYHSEDEPYKDRLASYQKKTGLPEAVQTGIGELNGIPVAVAAMDFEFVGGSMGSVVGEKITRLIEYATNQFLPLIIVCASGGARMQEGSVSLMQMAKISSALYDYQSNKKLFYVSILASPTTGGVTASFGMLGDIIIAEPNAYIAFAGKRVIEQTLNKTVPEGSQETEYLFEKGLFDLIVPRNLLKSVLTELFKLHALFPLTKNSNQNQIEC